ncbi:MAG: response regulator, partial [Deltaproteobacteria bacterium]|nr:response regulator [Deltaproteobacteria bacterium]
MKKHTILIVDTQQDVVNSLAGVLKEEGYDTLTASGGREALEKLKRNTVDLIISNGAMRELSTKELLGKVGRTYSHSRIILAGQEETCRKQLADDENEIYWFVTSPWERNDLLFTVRNAIKYADLLSKNEALLETVSVLAAKDISLDDKL